MSSFLERCRDAIGRAAVRYAIAAALIGLGVVILAFAMREGGLVLGALTASWLFFAGIAAGGVALSAAIRVAQGRWASALLPSAEACAGFFLPAWCLQLVIVAAAPIWIPGFGERGNLSWLLLAVRELGLTAVLFAVGRRLIVRSRSGTVSMRLALGYLLVYVVTLTTWTIDFVIGLHDWAPSTILPPYYFMCSLLAALAWSTFIAAIRKQSGLDPDGRHDAGKLLFGLVTFCAYLLWSAFLPTWYGNIPEETGQLLARWSGAYRPLTIAYVALAFVAPFVGLVLEAAKRNRSMLALGAASVLIGFVVERFLLVFPSLAIPSGPVAVGIAGGVLVGMGGAFVLWFGGSLGKASLPDRNRSVEPRYETRIAAS